MALPTTIPSHAAWFSLDDVHDLDGLRRIADLLTADAPSATS